ncbi:MAG: hypothetical protein ACFE85_14585 [Candidatus Hodarchaeota archaeon]
MLVENLILNETNFFESNNSDALLESTPPIIGCLISDNDGKSIVSFELYKGALEYFIKRGMNDSRKEEIFDLDLIPMYVCALKRVSEEINIQDLPSIELTGTNIKIQILFTDEFTIIFFLNPIIKFKIVKKFIENYLLNFFEEFIDDLRDIRKISSFDFIFFLERLGWEWILELNDLYLKLT